MLVGRFAAQKALNRQYVLGMSTMVLTKPLPLSTAVFALAAVGLGGCLGTSGTMVQFRDLADIPEKPAVTAREVNDRAAQSLAEDRARAAQAIEGLRNEPFSPPEPAPPVSIEEP
jgi:hypothetical protein